MLCVLLVLVIEASIVPAQSSPTADAISQALVIGQAYVSGNVYVGGFVDAEPRRWPARIEGVPLTEGRRERIVADFYRTVAQDSEEHYWFPQRESDFLDGDLFVTVDRAAIQDRNLARYRAALGVDEPLPFFGWDQRLGLADISYRMAGQARPMTAVEQKAVATKRSSIPKDAGCTTVPRFLDDAKVILNANVANTRFSIRLAKYSTPGCAGHLADIYVLDVLAAGEEPRRFEFLHQQGVI